MLGVLMPMAGARGGLSSRLILVGVAPVMSAARRDNGGGTCIADQNGDQTRWPVGNGSDNRRDRLLCVITVSHVALKRYSVQVIRYGLTGENG